MDGFESAIVKFVEENAEEYALNIKTKNQITVDPKNEYTIVQYGPITSIEAQKSIFEYVSEALEKNRNISNQKPSYSNSGYRSTLCLEDELQNMLIPTIIKDGIGKVLKKDENEARRLFKLGPKRY